MKRETRSFDEPVMVASVGRYTPAERSGLVAGDIVLLFGSHKTSALRDDPDLLQRIGGADWLTLMRNDVYFKLQPRDGLNGATFEPATPLENVSIPVDDGHWIRFTSGMQTDGSLLLVPQRISSLWALMPVLLYTRYKLWQMLTGALLVYGIAAFMGLVPFILTYIVTSLPVLTSGSYLIKSAAEKQGYARRGEVIVASMSEAAALELETAKRNREARKPQPVVKAVPAPALDVI